MHQLTIKQLDNGALEATSRACEALFIQLLNLHNTHVQLLTLCGSELTAAQTLEYIALHSAVQSIMLQVNKEHSTQEILDRVKIYGKHKKKRRASTSVPGV